MSRRALSIFYKFSSYSSSYQLYNLEYKVFHKKFSAKINLPALMQPHPPKSITTDVAFGVQNATKLFLTNGIGYQSLKKISKENKDLDTLTLRWRHMMEIFLGIQVHVIAGLGYSVNDEGLALYNKHLAKLLQETNSTDMDLLRVAGCEIWRNVLMTTFNISFSEMKKNERNIIEARNIMNQVSIKMIDPKVINIVTEKCYELNQQNYQKKLSVLTKKHEIIQEVLVHDVYLSSPSLVEKVGFGSGEKGYVLMQIIMAEYQHDPLIAKYIGSSMFQLFQAAGLDMEQISKDTPYSTLR